MRLILGVPQVRRDEGFRVWKSNILYIRMYFPYIRIYWPNRIYGQAQLAQINLSVGSLDSSQRACSLYPIYFSQNKSVGRLRALETSRAQPCLFEVCKGLFPTLGLPHAFKDSHSSVHCPFTIPLAGYSTILSSSPSPPSSSISSLMLSITSSSALPFPPRLLLARTNATSCARATARQLYC